MINYIRNRPKTKCSLSIKGKTFSHESCLTHVSGSSGVPAGSLSDQRERLPDVWCHASRGPVCWQSHQRKDRLRTHDFCWQGVWCFYTVQIVMSCDPTIEKHALFQHPIKVSPLISWYVTIASLVHSVTPERTNVGSFLAGFRSTSATAVWTSPWTRPSSSPSTSSGRWLSLSDRYDPHLPSITRVKSMLQICLFSLCYLG